MRHLLGVLTLTVLLAGCKTSQVAAPTDDSSDSKTPFKAFAEVLKEAEPIPGFFTTHLKRDRTLYLEVQSDRVDAEFGLIMHISRGAGVFGLHDGLRVGGTRLMRLERHGDKIYLVHVNPLFTADEDSPMKLSLDDNTGHSIIAAFDIEAEDTTSGAVLIDLTKFVVSDYGNMSERLEDYFDDKPTPFDGDRSYVSAVKGFPENVEIDAMLTFKGPKDPETPSAAGVSDYRSIPVGLRYSLFALPAEPMQPRLADDRVGHFITAIRDFSRDREPTPYVRYVSRWRLEKKDHSAERSEPVKPIVYYVDRSVPLEYRPYVREGIEAWNKAFDRAGFMGGIVAMDAPDDPDWSAEDVRYSTVRWSASHDMGFAIGPSQTDPRTGEILNADVLLSSTFVTSWGRQWRSFLAPQGADLLSDPTLAGQRSDDLCMAEFGKADQLALQYVAMIGQDLIRPGEPMPLEHIGDMIRDLVMHEVGHTLGLRHNFKSSAAIPNERLNDRQYTRENGLYASVMDYAPTNIAVDPADQGYYTNPEVGPYDVWAIQYSYAPVYDQDATGPLASTGTPASSPEAERAGLDKIASRASEPLLAYNTDEDARGGALSVDPLTNVWDLGSSPMAFALERAAVVARIEPGIEDRLVADGGDYSQLRSAYQRLISERQRSVLIVAKMIGGVLFVRDHRNDPGARSAFTPVSAEEQREAAQFVASQFFSETAFQFDPGLLNKLAPVRYADWSEAYEETPIDFPVHDFILERQKTVLAQLLDNHRLARVVDNTVRMPAGSDAFTVEELFGMLASEVWTELSDPSNPRDVSSVRRNLQRAFVDRMVEILLGVESGAKARRPPEDARSLARLELTELSGRIDKSVAAGDHLDRTTKAHLLESKARIDKALEQSISASVE